MAADGVSPCPARSRGRVRVSLSANQPPMPVRTIRQEELDMRPYLARAFRLRSSHKGTSLLASVGVAAASTLETLEARQGTAAVRLSQLFKRRASKQTSLQARLDQQTDHPFRVLGAERRQRGQ